jgi:hypothetical protein
MGQADMLAANARRREDEERREEARRVPVPWRWELRLTVRRADRPHASRSVELEGEVDAPTHNGHGFAVTALRRAMHAAGAAVAKQIRELDR